MRTNPHDDAYWGKDGPPKKKVKDRTTEVPEAHAVIEFDDVSILEPDENDLVREWHRQPKLFFTYAQQLAKARGELDYAEAELKVLRAEIDREIRENPTKFGLSEKPTEVAIGNTILLQVRHRKATRKTIIAQEAVNMLQAMVQSLDHRKAALENYVRLHGQSYFATPQADAEDKAVLDEARKKNVRRIKK